MFDFPATPTVGQVYAQGGATYQWNGFAWMQVSATPAGILLPRRNRIINPCMWVSQQNEDTQAAGTTSFTYYPADEWFASMGAMVGTITFRRTRPSDTYSDCIEINVAAGTPSPPADCYFQLQQYIEGRRVQDLMWGTLAAKQAIFRFNFWSNVAGTFTVQIKNADGSRSFLAPFTVTQTAVWKVYSVVVPGDTTGTWLYNHQPGITVGWGFLAGTMYGNGVPGWQAGNKVMLAGGTNVAAAPSTFYVTDVGFYEDVDRSGRAPLFEPTDFAHDEIDCMRYLEYVSFTMNQGVPYLSYPYKVYKRIQPTFNVIAGSLNGGSIGPIAYDDKWGMRQINVATAGHGDVCVECSARF